MPIVDRMEFPRRYKLRSGIIIGVALLTIFGIWMQRHSLQKQAAEIEISEVKISRFGSQFIELEYQLANKGKADRELSMIATVWDRDSLEIASALFSVDAPAAHSYRRSKLLDRLNRSLKEGERPYKAEIRLYTRKVP